MKPLQYPLHVTPCDVQTLHAFYIEHTRREQLLDARVESGWLRLLSASSLAGQRITIDDAKLVIRYLHRRVTDPGKLGPRHAGCLKLTADNLFNVEKFVQDLAEARAIMGRWKPKPKPAPALNPPPPAPECPDVPDANTAIFQAELLARKQRRAAA